MSNLLNQKPHQKKAMYHTKGEGTAHMAAVARLPCVICGRRPVHVHHAGTGAGGRKNDMMVLPLCSMHHTGDEGIHFMGRKAWREKFDTEENLLEKVERMLHGKR